VQKGKRMTKAYKTALITLNAEAGFFTKEDLINLICSHITWANNSNLFPLDAAGGKCRNNRDNGVTRREGWLRNMPTPTKAENVSTR
jgi:hypothetical protein